jgi:hypothetical protein
MMLANWLRLEAAKSYRRSPGSAASRSSFAPAERQAEVAGADIDAADAGVENGVDIVDRLLGLVIGMTSTSSLAVAW